jgi:hypothetical protein
MRCPDIQADEGGDMTISLKPLGQRRVSADQVADELRAKLKDIPGTSVTITNPPTLRVGARSRSTYQYTLQGLDFVELQRVSKQLMAALKDDPTFVGVNSDQDEVSPAVHVGIDRERAAALGVTPTQIETALGAAFGGQQISQIYASTDQYQVILELLPQYQVDASGLSRLYLTSTTGAMVPLTAVTDVSRSTMPPTINHCGQIPSITLSFDLAPGKALSDAVTAVKAAGGPARYRQRRLRRHRIRLPAVQLGHGRAAADRDPRGLHRAGHPLRKLHPPLDHPVGPARGGLRRGGRAIPHGYSAHDLRVCGHDHADRDREEERDHDDRLRAAQDARRRLGLAWQRHL